jgi:hypothetical protein
MKNERQRLAALEATESETDVLGSSFLLEQALRETIKVDPLKRQEIEQEIINAGNEIEGKNKNILKRASSASAPSVPSINSEKVLMELYDIREGLIIAFETCTLNTRTSKILNEQIIKAGKCISHLGGEVTAFNPFNHVSGLGIPNFVKNANKVVETTMQCYSLGNVEESSISNDGKQITILFSGSNENVQYKAKGIITAEEWTGNEAIDYIYTPGEGHMSVKAFENGRWVSKSANKNYHVVWELEEFDFDQPAEDTEAYDQENDDSKKENNIKNKNIITESDNGDGNDDEDIGSPIK